MLAANSIQNQPNTHSYDWNLHETSHQPSMNVLLIPASSSPAFLKHTFHPHGGFFQLNLLLRIHQSRWQRCLKDQMGWLSELNVGVPFREARSRILVEPNLSLKDWHVSPRSQVPDIVRIGQGLVGLDWWYSGLVGYQVMLLVVWSPNRQHYEVVMSVHCQESVSILIWP